LKKRQYKSKKKRTFQRHKICRFCADNSLAIDYKDYSMLRFFVTERGKIIPRRISGNCARHQRRITNAVKRARNIALIPFTVAH
jgi:small subunit ribosomal protein S18